MNDDSFMLDQARYTETQKSSESNEQPNDIEITNMKYTSIEFTDVGAYSFCWPYFTFKFSESTLMIINAYDKEYISRVQVADP